MLAASLLNLNYGEGAGTRRRKGKRVLIRGVLFEADDISGIRRALNDWLKEIAARDTAVIEAKPSNENTIIQTQEAGIIVLPASPRRWTAEDVDDMTETLRSLKASGDRVIRWQADMLARLAEQDDEDTLLLMVMH